MPIECDRNTLPERVTDNSATDSNAFATMELATTGSNLPLVFINAFGQRITDDGREAADFGIIHNQQLDFTSNPTSSQLNRIPAELSRSAFTRSFLVEIEVSGAGLLKYPKCAYDFEPKVPVTITFDSTIRADNATECRTNSFVSQSEGTEYDISDVKEEDEALLGMPTEDDWEMHGPYVDKTLMRNVLAHHLSDQMSGRYAPKTRWGEVLLSDHESSFPGIYQYRGVYVFTEKIEVDSHRVNLRKPPKPRNRRPPEEFGYLFAIGKSDRIAREGVISNFSSVGQNLSVSFLFADPHSGEVQDYRLKDYIKQTISDFETVLANLKDDDPLSVLESQMNVDSFVDYFLFTELAKNPDGYRHSTFFYKDSELRQGKITMGPARNYDLAFGNSAQCAGDKAKGWQFVCGEAQRPPDDLAVPFWWRKLTGNAAFCRKLGERWSTLRGDGATFDETRIQNFIDQQSTRLKSEGAIVRNEKIWNVLWQQIPPGQGGREMPPQNPTDAQISTAFDGEVNHLKEWFPARTAWLDLNLPSEANGYVLQEGDMRASSAVTGGVESVALIMSLILVAITAYL